MSHILIHKKPTLNSVVINRKVYSVFSSMACTPALRYEANSVGSVGECATL